MKSVLISIQPYWLFLIIAEKMGWMIDKKKTIEVRKNHPKDKNWDKTVKLYCSKDKKSFNRIPKKYQPLMELVLGKVIGEFVCDKIDRIQKRGIHSNFDYCYLSLNEWGNDDIEIEITDIKKSCISKEELNLYGEFSHCLYTWHISNLVIYDKPKKLSEFYTVVENEDCGKCRYYDTPCESEPCNQCQGGRKYLTRPPQSWMFCESEGAE